MMLPVLKNAAYALDPFNLITFSAILAKGDCRYYMYIVVK